MFYHSDTSRNADRPTRLVLLLSGLFWKRLSVHNRTYRTVVIVLLVCVPPSQFFHVWVLLALDQ